MMKSVTVDQVMEWNPCDDYTAERVTELFAGREALTAQDIAALDISHADRLWALLHNEFLTDQQIHLLACDFAEAVVHLCGDDPRPITAIEAKRAWLRGEIDNDQLSAARDAAWYAGADATRAAARDAARDAACAAAWAAAWAAACAAAWAAARDAAWAAARAAARDAQIDHVLEYIEMMDI
jgi:hypothetical protein